MKMGYFLIAVGLVCLFAGIIVYVNESKAKKNTPTDILVEKKGKSYRYCTETFSTTRDR